MLFMKVSNALLNSEYFSIRYFLYFLLSKKEAIYIAFLWENWLPTNSVSSIIKYSLIFFFNFISFIYSFWEYLILTAVASFNEK